MASNKTTKEERERIIQEALEATEETEETPEVEEEETTTADETQEVEETEDTETKPQTPKAPETPSQQDNQLPGLEERYKQSTREGQVLFAKQRKFAETVEMANQLPEPTDDEVKAVYTNWEDMTDTERLLAKDNYINRRKFDLVYQATQEGKQIEEWAEKVDSFLTVDASKYAKLAGREDEFKNFALKPTRRGLDMHDLAKLFLYDIAEAPSTPKRGSLLASGSSGNAPKPKPDFIDEKQAQKLRTSNHKLYQKLVREGKVKIEL